MARFTATLLFIFITFQNSTAQQAEISVYKERMVSFVSKISDYAKEKDPGFYIVPQNGILLFSKTSTPPLQPNHEYLNAIDAAGRESVFYGYNGVNEPTPKNAVEYINNFLKLAQDESKSIMVINYCWTPRYIDHSYEISDSHGFISFAADDQELDNIPSYPETPYKENDRDIHSLEEARNFLYLINTRNYSSKSNFVNEVSNTNFDLLVVDLFFHGDEALTQQDLEKLKTKANGGKRMVLGYMSIGEAEEYRYYWKRKWETNPPEWLEEENPNWEGNHLVEYWNPEWQSIIMGSEHSYLDRILATGFDGVYLDLVDAYHFFEND